MKKIFLSLVVILTVVAVTATATWAYFSDVDTDDTATIEAASIEVGEVTDLSVSFENILPGVTAGPQTVSLTNASSVAADFYMKLEPGEYGFNFCDPTVGTVPQALQITILEDGVTPRFNGSVCQLYTTITKIANDVPAGVTKTFTVSLTLSPLAGNEYQAINNTSAITLVATQYNAPAPTSVDAATGAVVFPVP